MDVVEPSPTFGFLRCPVCLGDLVDTEGRLACADGHSYSVVGGVPTMLSDQQAAAEISDTFSAQWGGFEYGRDTHWGGRVDIDHVIGQLEITVDDLEGKQYLDAGCGAGEVANEVAVRSRADVYATDISTSVYRAQSRFPDVSFFRSNLLEAAIKPETFDVVYSAGVLHHTPDTRAGVEQLAKAVRPGGRIFVWLYRHVESRAFAAKCSLRIITSRLPQAMQRPVVTALAAPPYLLHRDREWRAHWRTAHDLYTPRYRWVHTHEEVAAWFESLGFRDIHVSQEDRDGIGTIAYR
jgi:2-polyprenyl-3-methyl-5-hydroxy-6-metoxy-1,4-benzoquinol methylase